MEKKQNKAVKVYKVASTYIHWREIMALCQNRSLVSCCGKCKARNYCQVHRSYVEADHTLSFLNRQPNL